MNKDSAKEIIAIAGHPNEQLNGLKDKVQALLEQIKARKTEMKEKADIALEKYLLLQLAHLIKNDDYKDENECRILDIHAKGGENIKGLEGSGNLYIEDSRDMREFIHTIILGDKFGNPALFTHKLNLRLGDFEPSNNDNNKPDLSIKERDGTILAEFIKRKNL